MTKYALIPSEACTFYKCSFCFKPASRNFPTGASDLSIVIDIFETFLSVSAHEQVVASWRAKRFRT